MSKVFDVKKISTKEFAETVKRNFYRPFSKLNRKMIFGLSLVFVLGLFVLYFNSAKTESAVFYPDSCLGGWENPQNAAGEPETEFAADYNATNSAALFNSLAEVYCGGFSGEVPENAAPEKVFLKLNLAIRPQEEIATSAQEFYPEALNLGTTTEILLQETATSSPLSNFWKKIFDFKKVHAEEISENVLPSTLSPEPELPPVSSPETSLTPEIAITPLFLEPTLSPEIFLESATTTLLSPEPGLPPVSSPETSLTPETTTTTESVVVGSLPSDPQLDLLEVFYSLDGTIWISLGKIGLFDYENRVFELPVFDWAKLNQLQVKINHLPSETEEEIFLESLVLEIEYGEPDLNLLEISSEPWIPDFENFSFKQIRGIDGSKVVFSGLDASSSPGIYFFDFSQEQPISLRVATSSLVEMEYEFGLKDGSLFWFSPDQKVFVYNLDAKKYFTLDMVDWLEDEKKAVFEGKVASWKIIRRDKQIGFFNRVSGEVFSDDDGSGIENFNQKFLSDLSGQRFDLINLNLRSDTAALDLE